MSRRAVSQILMARSTVKSRRHRGAGPPWIQQRLTELRITSYFNVPVGCPVENSKIPICVIPSKS